MNLTEAIESAELRFKQILEDFFISVFDEKDLSSHGIYHHRRVWSYARELLFIHNRKSNSDLSHLPVKLIIACYLHDIGMSVDQGTRHGKHSKEFCLQFLAENNLKKDDFFDVLETIENHDRKDYSTETVISDLLDILSVADDLDAFGYAGIFRYSEIYLKRGIPPSEIGYLILKNAAMRFDNFVRTYADCSEYIHKHKIRYDILDSFFVQYNKRAESYNFEISRPSGYCGVIQLFILIIKNKISVNEFFAVTGMYREDKTIAEFFCGLKSDLS
jgi:hypothetical protein